MSSPSGQPEIEMFLSGYPDEMAALAERLRELVKRAVPEAVERLRPGWRLLGYDVPSGRRTRYFAYVAPEPIHVHLGFEYGSWLDDPERLLEGAHLGLRKVRYLTYRPDDELPEPAICRLLQAAANLALLSPRERMALALDREVGPPDG